MQRPRSQRGSLKAQSLRNLLSELPKLEMVPKSQMTMKPELKDPEKRGGAWR